MTATPSASTAADSPQGIRLPRSIRAWALAILALVHSGLLAWGAYRDSYTWDEPRYMVAGISHWHFGNFDLSRVNPPLVRMVATVPVLFADPELDWSGYTNSIFVRPEVEIGGEFLEKNGERSFFLLTLARWACIPFSLLGMFVCYLWARDLFGDLPGLLAAALWCFEPNILGHGHLITSDVGATALGVAAFFAFRHWLLRPTWRNSILAGVAFGLAQLAKTSWIILFGLWPLLWLMWRLSDKRKEVHTPWFREGAQLAMTFAIGVWLINCGYGFEGSFQRLDKYEFLSTSLTGDVTQVGNRFTDTILGSVPVPLPRNYVQGIDRQRYHFEKPDSSYLAGEWRDRGWYHYYVYAMYVKIPLGIWLFAYLALFLAVGRSGYSADRREEWLLIVPTLAVLLLVSSQTGFNRHMRYVLPLFPFAFILISRVAIAANLRHYGVLVTCSVAFVWSLMSSLMAYPHSLSYFNELGGGPRGGHAHLLSSNADWGQDLLYLKRWYENHPEARPLHLAWHVREVDPAIVGIESQNVPTTPKPGWHAASVNRIRSRTQNLRYLLDAEPVATAGYSIYIYHLTEAECAALRQGTKRVRP